VEDNDVIKSCMICQLYPTPDRATKDYKKKKKKKNTMICELQKIVLKRKIYVKHVARKGEIRSGEIMVEKNRTNM